MNNVCGAIYSSRTFSYNKDTKTFVSEVSDTPAVLRQLWNDSCDIGFGIRSDRTGEIVLFTIVKVLTDSENDIISWQFEVYNPRQKPELEGITVTIFND